MSTQVISSTHRSRIRLAVARLSVLTLMVVVLPAMLAGNARAQCVLLQERQGPEYTPHISIHFGDPEQVPGSIQCSTMLSKRTGYWCIPIYAWNLWDDSRNVEFAIKTPIEPTGFDRGPQISGVQMILSTDETGTTTSFELSADQALCGPTMLGCLRLSAEDLPQSFTVTLGEHILTQRKAVQSNSGNWREFSVHAEGSVGGAAACGDDLCDVNRPVADLKLSNSVSPGRVDLSWTSGSGSFTLMRYRTDGRFPTDPWDGELMAFLPSSVEEFNKHVDFSGDVHVTAWSVTRGLNGRLLQSSTVECGSVSSLMVHQPIAIEQVRWQQMKSLYR